MHAATVAARFRKTKADIGRPEHSISSELPYHAANLDDKSAASCTLAMIVGMRVKQGIPHARACRSPSLLRPHRSHSAPGCYRC